MKANEKQIDNLVQLLDGYIEKRGHHLNVNVFSKETLLDAQAHPESSVFRTSLRALLLQLRMKQGRLAR